MPNNIEMKLGVYHPLLTDRKFVSEEPIVEELAMTLCEIFELDPKIVQRQVANYVAQSLNRRAGHPARLILLKIIFKTIHGYTEETMPKYWRH